MGQALLQAGDAHSYGKLRLHARALCQRVFLCAREGVVVSKNSFATHFLLSWCAFWVHFCNPVVHSFMHASRVRSCMDGQTDKAAVLCCDIYDIYPFYCASAHSMRVGITRAAFFDSPASPKCYFFLCVCLSVLFSFFQGLFSFFHTYRLTHLLFSFPLISLFLYQTTI